MKRSAAPPRDRNLVNPEFHMLAIAHKAAEVPASIATTTGGVPRGEQHSGLHHGGMQRRKRSGRCAEEGPWCCALTRERLGRGSRRAGAGSPGTASAAFQTAARCTSTVSDTRHVDMQRRDLRPARVRACVLAWRVVRWHWELHLASSLQEMAVVGH
eukprot:2567202-Rhodomonas_salina.1